MFSEIIGNFVGGLIITRSSGPFFFILNGGISLIAGVGFMFQMQPKILEKISKTDDSINHVTNVLKLIWQKKMRLLIG